MGCESADTVRWSRCRGLLCFITVVVACVVVPGCEKARSVGWSLEPAAQAETAQQAPPIPPAGPLADPKSPKQFGVPVEATRAAAPADNPQTAEKIALGEKLFFDGRLSVDGTVSCSTCHDPARAFSDGRVVSIGVKGRVGQRNAPTILNVLYNNTQFWDGRAKTLEEQAGLPIINPSEMGQPNLDAAVARIAAVPEYDQAFRAVFGRPFNGTFFHPLADPPQSPSTTPDSARGDENVPAAAAALIPLPDRVVLPGICSLSSPPGSATHGSCGTHAALVSGRFPGCASAAQSVDLYACDSETFRDLTG
jgi:hypothetical protein